MGNGKDKKIILLKDKAVYMTCEEAYEQFNKFIHKLVQPWATVYGYDDLLSVGNVGFMKAYNSYDSRKEILFMTYVARVANNEILMYTRRNKKHVEVAYLSSTFTCEKDDSELNFEDTVSDDIDYAEVALTSLYNDDLQLAISNLKEREQTIIKEMFFNNLTQNQVAEKLSISQSYISRLIRTTLVKLKKYYENGGIRKVDKRKISKITKEQLLEECRILGTGHKAIAEISKKYGLSLSTINTYINRMGIKEELTKNSTIENDEIENEVNETNPEHINECKTLIAAPENVKEIALDPTFKPENIAVESKRILQPFLLKGKVMEYKIENNRYVIKNLHGKTTLVLDASEIDDFISELQELRVLKSVC